MYNQDIKERFLAEFAAKDQRKFRSKFDAISIQEFRNNKDFAEMQFDEAIDAIKDIKIGTYNTATSVQNFVCSYVRWCADNAVFENVNLDLLSIKTQDIDASGYLSKMWFLDESDLINRMRVVRSFDDGYYEVIALLFAWLGINQKSLLSIKPEDVNIKERYIRVDGCLFSFSEEIASVISQYSKTMTGSRQYNGEPTTVYRDFYGSFICKFCKKKELGTDVLTDSQIGFAIGEMNRDFTDMGNVGCFKYTNVQACGAAKRIFDLEQSGVDVLSMKNKDTVKSASRLNIKRCELLWLYQNYKRAFNL